MYFEHSPAIWSDYPELVAGAVFATGITSDAGTDSHIAMFTAIADSRLAASSESELPEIQAWRRAFSRMGLRPTQPVRLGSAIAALPERAVAAADPSAGRSV